MSERSGRPLVLFAVMVLLAGGALAQVSTPTPEFFGVYALDGGKLVAIGGGRSDTAPSLRQVAVVLLGNAQASQRTAVQVGAGVRFLLFDIAPADAARSLSLYRLPFVRSNITVSDIPDFSTGRRTATQRPVNLPGVMRLSASQIQLLQKPVAAQPQMIELVPNSALPAGLYGLLYAPATAMAVGGAGAGQNAGWTSILLVGDLSDAATSESCIDLILTGGLGGMLGIDSPDSGSIRSFPLLDPNRAPACAASVGTSTSSRTVSAPRSESTATAANPEPPSVPYRNRETANSSSLAELTASLERGDEVVFAVRKGLNEVHKWGEIGSHEVIVSKREVAFREKGGAKIFSVTPDKILALSKDCIDGFRKARCPATLQGENNVLDGPQTYHLRLNIAVLNPKGEEKKNFDFYHPAAGSANGTHCVGCDASMDSLYALLQRIKDNR